MALALLAPLVHAEPADDHQRGLLAFQRGDVAGAMAALRVGARAGHGPSLSLLAFILDRADVSGDAARLYREAAAQDDADGHAGLADMHLTGRGVAKDEKLALQHFSKAAALGHGLAIDVVANAWLKGQFGADAAADPATARAAWQRAAGQGHLPSAEALAEAHRRGLWGLPVDAVQAAQWQARAAAWRVQRAAASAPAPAPARPAK